MLDGIKNYLYLVVDRETNFVLTRCANASIANAVSRGFANSSIMVIVNNSWFNDDRIKNYSNEETITFKLTINNFSGIASLESNIGEKKESNYYFDLEEVSIMDEDWIKNRKIANIRSYIFSVIESKIERYLARHISFVGEETLYSFISENLQKCNPTKNYYTEPLLEYSEILSIDPKEAYYDLKMKYESYNCMLLRYSAIWEKLIERVNEKVDLTNIKTFYYEVESELAGMNR